MDDKFVKNISKATSTIIHLLSAVAIISMVVMCFVQNKDVELTVIFWGEMVVIIGFLLLMVLLIISILYFRKKEKDEKATMENNVWK
jgi:predicted membrane channel-forming protein YqfA (hemolysin III family)